MLFFLKKKGNGKAAEYLMQGASDDISAINFLAAQILKEKRKLWDKVNSVYCYFLHHFTNSQCFFKLFFRQ